MKLDADRIAPKLWVGSYPPAGPLCRDDVCFDVLVLAAREDQQARDVPVLIRVPLDDTEEPMSRKDVAMTVNAARTINSYRAQGCRVLVTCMAGVNRSALVAAMALVDSGWTAPGAIEALRAQRNPPTGHTPLFNRRFVAMLRAFGAGQLHAFGGVG